VLHSKENRSGLILLLVLLVAFALLPQGQTQTNTKGVYFTGSAPATCNKGELWSDVDDAKLYKCSATNTWTEFTGATPQALDTTDTPRFAALGLGVAATSSGLNHIMGTGSGSARMVGVATKNITAVGNVGAGTDNLMTYALPASALSADAMGLEIWTFGTLAANGNSKVLQMVFGGTEMTAVTTSQNNGHFTGHGLVFRTGATTQVATAWFEVRSSAGDFIVDERTYSTPGETLSGAVTIKMTGTATSDNDIIQKAMIVNIYN
jgi:hypothetical protein